MSTLSLDNNNSSNHALSAYYMPGTTFSPPNTQSHFLLPNLPPFLRKKTIATWRPQVMCPGDTVPKREQVILYQTARFQSPKLKLILSTEFISYAG